MKYLGLAVLPLLFLSHGECSVSATADCDSVTVTVHVPKGENGHTVATVTVDGKSYPLEFDGVDGGITVSDEGTGTVSVDVIGSVTVGEKVKNFHLVTTAERDCKTETPPPSKTPPVKTTKPPTPDLAFTGFHLSLLDILIVAGLIVVGIGLLRLSRR